jgi:hypothetical protein
MSDTTFINRQTPINAEWLNVVNDAVYQQTSGISGATARTLASKLGDFVSVHDFGAVGNGTTDDTAAIQAALTSGKNVMFGAGRSTYRITGTLNFLTDQQVIDLNFSTIQMDDSSGLLSHLTVGDNVTQLAGVKIRNGILTRTQAATAGAAINCRYVGVLQLDNLRVYGASRIYQGITINRGIIVNITNCYIQDTVSYGLFVQGTGAGANRSVDITVKDCRIEGTGGEGLNCFDFTEGVFCKDTIFYNNSTAAVTINATNTTNGLFSFKFEGCDFDTADGLGLVINNVNNVTINDCWFSNNTGINLYIDSGVDSFIVTGNQAYATTAKNFHIAGDNAVISGNLLSGGEDGMFIRSTVANCIVSSNLIRSMTGYGINQLEGPTNLVIGADNAYASNSLGNVSA